MSRGCKAGREESCGGHAQAAELGAGPRWCVSPSRPGAQLGTRPRARAEGEGARTTGWEHPHQTVTDSALSVMDFLCCFQAC